MAETKTYTPLDPTGLSRLVVILLYVDIAAAVVSTLAAAVEFRAYGALPGDTAATFGGGPDLPPMVEVIRGLGGLVQVLAFLVVGFFILKWIYRTSRNAHALAKGLTITPPWAVGWFFVPIAFLFKPYQAFRETWQVSSNPAAWASEPTPSLLGWWWGRWLVSNILGNISSRISFSAKTVDLQMISDAVEVASTLMSIPADLVFIVVVQRLSRMQTKAISQQVFA